METDDALFPRDHNQGGLSAEARQAIRLELNIFAERRDEIVRKADAFVLIRDRIDVQKATDICGIGKTIGEMVDVERKKISGPYYDAQRAVNDYAVSFWAPALGAITALEARLETYAREEEDRISAQAAEQAAHEATLRANAAAKDPAAELGIGRPLAPAPPPPPPAAARPRAPARQPEPKVVRSDYGYAARREKVLVVEIDDVSQLPPWVFQSEPVREAIIATVKPLIAKKVPVPGITSRYETKTRVGK